MEHAGSARQLYADSGPISTNLYRRHTMHRLADVCLSICVSQSDIVSKQINLSS